MTNDEIAALEKRARTSAENHRYGQHYSVAEFHDDLADAIAHLRAEVNRLTRELESIQMWADARASVLEELTRVRAEAFEEAATTCDHFGEMAYADGLSEEVVMSRACVANDCAAAIRALAKEPPK